MTQTRTNTPRCTLLIAQARTDTPRCTLLIAQARTDTPRCTLLMTQTRTNTPRCTLWVAQARVNTPQCYFKVCRAGRTPYLYSSREFTEHLRTFLKIQKNCVLRALLPFGGHLATFHRGPVPQASGSQAPFQAHRAYGCSRPPQEARPRRA